MSAMELDYELMPKQKAAHRRSLRQRTLTDKGRVYQAGVKQEYCRSNVESRSLPINIFLKRSVTEQDRKLFDDYPLRRVSDLQHLQMPTIHTHNQTAPP